MHPVITALASTATLLSCPQPETSDLLAVSIETTQTDIDGLNVPGRIRANGLVGLVSVPGTLFFADGQLVWQARDTRDCAPYTLTPDGDAMRFTAHYRIENDEHVRWSGWTDGTRVRDVTAVWTRVEGDFVHDLFLPDEVLMVFTPDAER